MSEIEVDLVRFTAGPRKGHLAVAVGHDYWNQILDLHGEPIIEWDAMSFTLDQSEWTDDMHFAEEWLKRK